MIFIQNALLPWQHIVQQWWNTKFAYLCTTMVACAKFQAKCSKTEGVTWIHNIFILIFIQTMLLPWQHNDQQWRKVKFAHLRTIVVRCAKFQAKCSKTEVVTWIHNIFVCILVKRCCYHGNALFTIDERLSLHIYMLKLLHVPNVKPITQRVRELTESTIFLYDFHSKYAVTMATHWSTLTKEYVYTSTYHSGLLCQISS